MSVRSLEALQQYVGRMCDLAVAPEDSILLKRFVEANDRDAFELLIARHGPMVLGTARRLVEESHDAEDVFQAVFLSLARQAKSIRHGRALPAWLYRATGRIAARVRANRPASPEPPPEPLDKRDPAAGLLWQEIRQALDEELQRLPERLRLPLLLCYLSGLTRDEAARQLGWSLGTLKRRLEKGRTALRSRLARRGIASVGLALAVLTPEALQASVGQLLLDSTLGLIFSTGAGVPATIAALVLSSAGTTKGLAMKSILALLVAIALGVGIHAGTGQADPPTKAEGKKEEGKPAREEQVVRWDDPLPAGSTLRFGTSRYRYGTSVHTLAVSPDGKRVFAANDNDVPRLFDLASGRVLLAPNYGSIEVGSFTPDGRAIVIKQSYDLIVLDVATGKEIRTIKGPRPNSWSDGLLEFTPDGKALAVTSQGKFIHLIDFESGKTIRDFTLENPESALGAGWSLVLGVAFSPDGKLMATGGYDNDKGNYFARLWDVETGKELRRFMLGKQGYGTRCLAFSPDAKTLATLGTQADVILRLFDVDTGKERRAFPKDGNVRPDRGSVAFSPDGKTVAAARASIRLYDTTTGVERLCIDRKASNLCFTDGGKTLTGAVDGAIYRWDAATGKTLTPEGADSVVEQILVTPDGGRVVTRGQYSHAHLWDGANGKHLRRFQAAWQRSLAMSPDGRFLAWPVDVDDESVRFTVPREPNSIYYGSRVRLYDMVADRFVDRFPAFKGAAQDVAFTNDGKKLITGDAHPGTVRIWDVDSAKEVRNFPVLPDDLKKQSYFVGRTQLSPDGKTAVVTYTEDLGGRLGGVRGSRHVVRLWDVATGKELPELSGSPVGGAFSPDGRLVVTRGGNSVYEIATGKRVAALPDDLLLHIRAAAFSRDGRYMATAAPEDRIQIWEVATWTKRNEFKGYRGRSITLTFGPEERLFSGHQDTTVLAWDTRPSRVAASASLESAWNDLATREAGVSFKSEGRFLAAPAETVKLFAEKVTPVAALDPKQIHRLLADLGSDVFAVREAGSKALLDLDHQATPYLKETLKSTESAEVRARVQRILEEKRRAVITSEQLRQIRAVMVLERIGDGESKNQLKRWAGGPVGALLTMEASLALKRLEAAPKATR